MAKKEEKQKKQRKERSTTHTTNIVNILAFCALTAAALLLLIGPFLRWMLNHVDVPGGAITLQILNTVAMYCLLGAIAIPSWHFVRGKRKGWRIFYFIMLAVYVLATVFGVTFGILG